MSYKKIYEALKAYQPKRLIRYDYKTEYGCCAVGALASHPETLPELDVAALYHTNDPGLLEILRVFDCTPYELHELQEYNDEGDHATPGARYRNVLEFLEREMAKETP